ncbi:unnamed protein product [Brachionus calyciflorus]|uniref:ATP-dependent DNA helicase n=1 Tax=Brachionus calyciflorus TaxID=104777 RepID=A0A814F393_9BILA|nr:unnamed protein product [Brachionus calyciflorus]
MKRKIDNKNSKQAKQVKLDSMSRYDIDESYIYNCMKKFLYNTNIQNFSRKICAVCGEIKISPQEKISKRPINYLIKYKDILTYKKLAYRFNETFFAYMDSFAKLNGLVLEPNGFNHEDLTINICGSCEAYLKNLETPKYGLINELYIGPIPKILSDLTFSEEILIAKNRLICSIFKLKKNNDKSCGQNKIIGNIITFNQDIETVSQILPNLIHLENLNIILVGAKIEKTLDFKKIFSVRLHKIISALKWLKANNAEYNDIQIDEKINLDLDQDSIPKILKDKIINFDDPETENIISEHHVEEEIINDELLINSYGLVNNNNRLLLNDKEKILKLNEILKNKATTPLLLVPRSDKPINEYNNPSLLLQLYPTLFPYGFGGFSDNLRKVKLTEREQTKHYLKTSCERFIQNRTFIFVAFNMIQRHEFSQNLTVMTKKQYFKQVSEIISRITQDDIRKEISNVLNSGEINNINIQTLFYQTVVMAKSTQGSRFNLKHRRNDIKSYLIKKGLPSFYITINPNDLNSPLVLFLSGKKITDNLIKRSIDIANNPITQSLNFDIVIKNFIYYLLGAKNPNKIGIFGKLNGYYGMVEAQARGSLHIHFLIWLTDSVNPDEFEKIINDKLKMDELINYISRHVKCNLSDLKPNWKAESNTTKETSKKNILQAQSTETFNEKKLNEEIFILANETNIHHCTQSCLKNKKCRYGFGVKGKQLNKETKFDSSKNLILKRDHGFLNNYNPYLLYCLRCNHDIQWIEKSKKDSLASIYYITNYVTKNGISIHNFLSFVSVYFERYHDKNFFDDHLQKAKRILQNIFTICTSQTEYSAAQIAHMIFEYNNDGTYYSSDETILLYYPKYLKYFNTDMRENEHQIKNNENQLINIKNDTSDNNFDDIFDYIYRPLELEYVCLYDFYSSYKKIFKSKINEGQIIYRFLKNHPQKSSVIIENVKQVVPVLLGKTITDYDQETYSKIILILFKPWRNNLNLINNNETYIISLTKYLDNDKTENTIKNYIRNIQSLKQSKNDGIDQYHANLLGETSNNERHIFEPILEIDSDDICITDLLNSDNVNNFLTATISFKIDYQITPIDTEYLMGNKQKENTLTKLVASVISNVYFSTEFLEKAKLLSVKTNILTIDDIIKIFNLNYKQSICCKLFLNSESTQKLIYLGGNGGVGKSRVINAIEFFFNFNKRKDAVRICAFTGTAANLVNGKTIHSTFKIKYKSNENDEYIYLNFDDKTAWNKVEYLIIDEISMVSLNLLANIDLTLREIKDKNSIFGNLNILFVGDFFQFPPVAAYPLYKNIKFNEEILRTDQFSEKMRKAYNGRILWLHIKDVIFLDEPMRQINDLNYADFLTRVKNGKATVDDIYDLKKRIINSPISDPFTKNIIVPNNSFKMQIINSIIHNIEIQNSLIIIKAKAIDSILHEKSNQTEFSPINVQITEYLRTLEESKTEYLSINVPLSHCIKYYLTHTVNSALGLTNGSIINIKKLYLRTNGEINHILCELTDYRRSFQIEDLEINHFNLERLNKYFKITINKTKYTIKRQQFPISPKFVSTCHKVQGKTLDNMIVDLNLSDYKSNPCCYLYVALSR